MLRKRLDLLLAQIPPLSSSVDESLIDAAEESRLGAEVKQQANFQSGATQGIEKLALRIRGGDVSRSHLDEHFSVHEQIVSVVADAHALIQHLDKTLSDAMVT